MGKYAKFRAKILSGVADNDTDFAMLCQLLVRLGIGRRCRGSHQIFSKEGVVEIINLQPKGSAAKTFQVKQVRDLLLKYHLGAIDVD